MSGSSIGGAVGGVIGFVVSGFNPYGFQIGFMAGSAVGGYVDPDVIKGPRLKDAQVQTSMEGAPRPIVYGVSAVAGNIIQSGPLVETKKRKRTGKGGPVQETYHYSRSYAIRVCEGPIAGISRIWRDDKLVYDTRNPADWPDDPNVGVIDADSAKIASIMTIYTGDETQLPDPTLEALPAAHGGGVGNVPSYRGTAYVVFANDDLTERRGTVPQYRFEVVSVGSTAMQAATVDAKQFASDVLPWATGAHLMRDPRKTGVQYEYGYTRRGFTFSPTTNTGNVWGFSSAKDAIDAAIAAGHTGGRLYAGSLPVRAWSEVGSGSIEGAAHPSYPWSGLTLDANTRNILGLHISRYPANIEHDGSTVIKQSGSSTVCAVFNEPIWTYDRDAGGSYNNSGVLVNAATQQFNVGTAEDSFSCDGGTGTVNSYLDFVVWCRPVTSCVSAPDAEWLAIPDSPGWYTDSDGNTFNVPECSPVSGSYKQLATHVATDSEKTMLSFPQGPTLEIGDSDDNQTFWDAAYATAVGAGWMAAGKTYQADGLGSINTYPRVISEACECVPALPQVSIDQIVLSYVVTDLCGRVGLDASQLEVSQLTDIVPGFVCGTQMNASAAIKALQSGYFFDFPEWDKQLHGIKRGGAVLFDIPDDDLVESDSDEEVRAQAVEFPRKLNLIVPDSSAAYAPTKQTATRNTDNIRAVGEVTAELPINFPRDVAAQKAAIMLKLTWTDAEGRITRILPEEYTRLTPSDPFTHAGKRWRADRVEYRDGTVKVEAVRDRASVYTSGATSAPIQTPTAPISSTRGPTVFAAMNLPRLRTQDSSPGMYLAAQGIQPGWQGAEIQMSVDGGLTYQSVAVITDPATIGTLTAPVGASGEPVQVKVYPGGDLESVTDAQLAAKENGFAITTAGVSEVGQFKFATETAIRTYDLTTVTRGRLGTTAAAHTTGDQFVLLDGAVVFLPIDIIHSGKTLKFRPVSIGTAPENNPTYDVVYSPIFTAPALIDIYTNASGDAYTNAAGISYYKVR